jgi:hypothetical protein
VGANLVAGDVLWSHRLRISRVLWLRASLVRRGDSSRVECAPRSVAGAAGTGRLGLARRVGLTCVERIACAHWRLLPSRSAKTMTTTDSIKITRYIFYPLHSLSEIDHHSAMAWFPLNDSISLMKR